MGGMIAAEGGGSPDEGEADTQKPGKATNPDDEAHSVPHDSRCGVVTE
jgi:hypothetical protein